MNVTFMIGNGFDLNVGLKTGYSDFLKWYLENDCSLNCTDDCNDKCEKYQVKKFKKDISKNKQLWSYAELAFGEYTIAYSKDDIEKFLDCHDDFCNQLSAYLKIEQSRLPIEALSGEMKRSFHTSLLNCHKTLREVERHQIIEAIKNINEQITFNFINFNYTDTLKKIRETNNNNIGNPTFKQYYNAMLGSINHVHGTVDKDMVLGLNDESQIKNITLFENTPPEYLEQIIKLKTNMAFAENADVKACTVLNSSSLIYIYGMSIGATDAIWWTRICELMSKKSNLHVIIYAYDAPIDDLRMRKFSTYKRELITNFLSYSNYSDATNENIRSRIHVDNKNIFASLRNIVYEDAICEDAEEQLSAI